MKTYKLLKDRFGHKAGTIIYMGLQYDYGLASDDERVTGIIHESMTLNSDGSIPMFTVPIMDFEEII